MAPGRSYPSVRFDMKRTELSRFVRQADRNFGFMEAETVTQTEKLVGKYFHSASENDKVEWQGVVVEEPHPGWYLVQLFDWTSGEPSVQRLVPIEKMTAWLFYPDRAAMKSSSKYG